MIYKFLLPKNRTDMKLYKWLLLIATLPLLASCFEDETTHADRPLSHITIEQGIDTLYNIYKLDTLVSEFSLGCSAFAAFENTFYGRRFFVFCHNLLLSGWYYTI